MTFEKLLFAAAGVAERLLTGSGSPPAALVEQVAARRVPSGLRRGARRCSGARTPAGTRPVSDDMDRVRRSIEEGEREIASGVRLPRLDEVMTTPTVGCPLCGSWSHTEHDCPPPQVGEWVIYTRGGGNGDVLAQVLRVRGHRVELDFGNGQAARAADVRPGDGEPHTYRRMGL